MYSTAAPPSKDGWSKVTKSSIQDAVRENESRRPNNKHALAAKKKKNKNDVKEALKYQLEERPLSDFEQPATPVKKSVKKKTKVQQVEDGSHAKTKRSPKNKKKRAVKPPKLDPQEVRKREDKRRKEEKVQAKNELDRRTHQWQKNQATESVRIPKLSALLAMSGGREAQEYKERVAASKLATWTNHSDKWKITRETFDGAAVSETKEEQTVTGSILKGMERFRTNPEKYLAMIFPATADQSDPNATYTYILREGTTSYKPQNLRSDDSGQFVVVRHMYQRLEPLKDDVLPAAFRDEHTDTMRHKGKKLHHNSKTKPILPGRGMGIGDAANMKFIGNHAEPSDVFQGSVGNCWLLSAIACLADFDFAVKRLFRKTPNFPDDCPVDEPNKYVVTLWDLKTWKEVDVVVDERLPVQTDGSGFLLGAKPSRDGKFWVPYLEKAISVHCGGWDKLEGGKCTDAWPMLTGSRNQFVIMRNAKTQKYGCYAKFNPLKGKWTDHRNSPHDYDQSCWRVGWPKVGGGGNENLDLTQEELFARLVAWNDTNYLIGAGTDGVSDKASTDGIVDNHAYSVIDSRTNVCGTGIDLLLVRNPWGRGGEIKNGQFIRNGPGWDRYPSIRKELNPAMEDNGLFWMTKEEFFRYFPTVYLSALNMSRLQEKDYINDLQDELERRPSQKKGATKKHTTTVEDDYVPRPIVIDKTSDPSSPYRIKEQYFNGGLSYLKMNKKVVSGTSIVDGVKEFKAHPEKYLAIHYQTSTVTQGWPDAMHQFTYLYRDGTEDIELEAVGKDKTRTILWNVLR